MRIGVIGAGHVGLVTAAGLAHLGHQVLCQDKSQSKITALREGRLPFHEPYLDQLVHMNVARGLLSFAYQIDQVVSQSEMVLVCVGTPPSDNGEVDLTAVEEVVREILLTARGHKTIVAKSTVPVQTGVWVREILDNGSAPKMPATAKGAAIASRFRDPSFDLVSNPEFLREGAAIYDFFHPYRIVVGVENQRAEAALRQVYAPLMDGTFACPLHEGGEKAFHPEDGQHASAAGPHPKVPFLVSDIASAEIIKHAANAFLSMKISFINAVADICELTGADIKAVAEGIGIDPRIGREFLNAGIGFGGYCLPKDLKAFYGAAAAKGYDFALLREVERINKSRVDRLLSKLGDVLGDLTDKPIAVLGLSFKPGTDDTRFSPALAVVERLLQAGALVRAYDPQAMPHRIPCADPAAFPKGAKMSYCADAYQAAASAQALLLLTEWPELLELDYQRIKRLMARPLVIDGRNALDKGALLDMGFIYMGMGR